jgi:hypothetical protein
VITPRPGNGEPPRAGGLLGGPPRDSSGWRSTRQPLGFNRQPLGFNRQPLGFNRQPLGFNRQPLRFSAPRRIVSAGPFRPNVGPLRLSQPDARIQRVADRLSRTPAFSASRTREPDPLSRPPGRPLPGARHIPPLACRLMSGNGILPGE